MEFQNKEKIIAKDTVKNMIFNKRKKNSKKELTIEKMEKIKVDKEADQEVIVKTIKKVEIIVIKIEKTLISLWVNNNKILIR